ncbi:MAG: hypothetical protein MZV64_05690 [Ignavibacteriales bacterium]|nr:hypothetical protein [Ignavibacteriales bacterium]
MSKGQDSKKGSKKEPAKTMKEKKQLRGIRKTKKINREYSINNFFICL